MSARRNPFEMFERMMEQMSRQLEEATREWDGERFGRELGQGSMGIDLADRGDEFVATADVPGFQKDEIDLRFQDDTLSISASRQRESEEEDETYLRSERERRSMQQRVRIPEPVEEDRIEATLTNGVLTIRLPKAEPTERGGHRIEIQ